MKNETERVIVTSRRIIWRDHSGMQTRKRGWIGDIPVSVYRMNKSRCRLSPVIGPPMDLLEEQNRALSETDPKPGPDQLPADADAFQVMRQRAEAAAAKSELDDLEDADGDDEPASEPSKTPDVPEDEPDDKTPPPTQRRGRTGTARKPPARKTKKKATHK